MKVQEVTSFFNVVKLKGRLQGGEGQNEDLATGDMKL